MPDLRKSSSGAFDLPSIVTGAIIVGILAAGVLAAIFGVIPYSQNNGAKQDLSSIRTAEGVAKAKDNRFMDHQRLLDIGYLQLSSTKQTKVMSDEKGTCYVALAKSGTGKIFYSTDTHTDPEIFTASTVTGCLTAEQLAELVEEVGGLEEDKTREEAGNEASTPEDGSDDSSSPEGTEAGTEKGDEGKTEEPGSEQNGNAGVPVKDELTAPSNLKLDAVSAIEAKATWDPVKGSTGYKIEYQVNGGDWAEKTGNTHATSARINALPEDTITVRVQTLMHDDVSEHSSATVKLPDSVLTNPGFENDFLGWAQGSDSRIMAKPGNAAQVHSGNKAAYVAYYPSSQVVTVPGETPVLTFWAKGGAPTVTVAGAVVPTTVTQAAAENGFYQYSADLSAHAGKAVTIGFSGSAYMDDVALEKPMAPSKPLTVTAVSKSGKATVSWAAPVFSGGGIPVTAYTAVAMADGVQVASVKVAGDQRTAVFTGLETDTEYFFTVTATNETGTSPNSDSYGPVMVTTGVLTNPGFENDFLGWTKGADSRIMAKPGDAAQVHSGNKAAYVAYYPSSQVVTVPGETPVLTFWAKGGAPTVTVAGAVVPTTVTQAAAENGFYQYSADLSAHAGKAVTIGFSGSAYMDDVALEKPMAPSKPLTVTAVSKSGKATVSWAAPVFSGGGIPVTAYTAVAMADGVQVASVKVAGDQRTAVFTGLETDTEYFFTVTATNETGTSPNSDSYGPVMVTTGVLTNPGFENDFLGWT
ncbi:fibronectin type III domain-containing protein, partial [Arthrobacter caoxuetaonis]